MLRRADVAPWEANLHQICTERPMEDPPNIPWESLIGAFHLFCASRADLLIVSQSEARNGDYNGAMGTM